MEKLEFIPTNYPSDLTDEQWKLIEEYLPQDENSTHHKRSLVNAVLYLVDCQFYNLACSFIPSAFLVFNDIAAQLVEF